MHADLTGSRSRGRSKIPYTPPTHSAPVPIRRGSALCCLLPSLPYLASSACALPIGGFGLRCRLPCTVMVEGVERARLSGASACLSRRQDLIFHAARRLRQNSDVSALSWSSAVFQPAHGQDFASLRLLGCFASNRFAGSRYSAGAALASSAAISPRCGVVSAQFTGSVEWHQ